MKYYKQIQALLILTLIIIICLWLYGCGNFTSATVPKSPLIKTTTFKNLKNNKLILCATPHMEATIANRKPKTENRQPKTENRQQRTVISYELSVIRK
ncbi:hypothetical protein SAMN05444396_10713 [Flavobacterium segetis]|uniref:Lipoprotein n=1 Tax=Flavobacterium segetis TaxID=271157 RepID=A0A1M5IFR8_9FLAO|nr:hypothetical protein [Flavobacterium segetis]SHG26919.1 hypothetical protein SAMN05444396_10713 [Flavobacterium segetis]